MLSNQSEQKFTINYHNQVPRYEIKENGLLLSSEEIKKVIQTLQNKPDKRFSKQELEDMGLCSNYSIIKNENRYFVVYRKHQYFSKGGQGKLKIAQYIGSDAKASSTSKFPTLSLGEVVLDKIVCANMLDGEAFGAFADDDMTENHKYWYMAHAEQQILEKIGNRVLSKVFKTSKQKYIKFQFLQKILPGIELEVYLNGPNKRKKQKRIITLETAFTLLRNIFISFQSLIDKNIAHHDIAASNVLLEEKSQEVHFIDFGASQLMDSTFDLRSLIRGQKGYVSPEVWHGIVNEKTEIFSLGKLFLNVLENVQQEDKGSDLYKILLKQAEAMSSHFKGDRPKTTDLNQFFERLKNGAQETKEQKIENAMMAKYPTWEESKNEDYHFRFMHESDIYFLSKSGLLNDKTRKLSKNFSLEAKYHKFCSGEKESHSSLFGILHDFDLLNLKNVELLTEIGETIESKGEDRANGLFRDIIITTIEILIFLKKYNISDSAEICSSLLEKANVVIKNSSKNEMSFLYENTWAFSLIEKMIEKINPEEVNVSYLFHYLIGNRSKARDELLIKLLKKTPTRILSTLNYDGVFILRKYMQSISDKSNPDLFDAFYKDDLINKEDSEGIRLIHLLLNNYCIKTLERLADKIDYKATTDDGLNIVHWICKDTFAGYSNEEGIRHAQDTQYDILIKMLKKNPQFVYEKIQDGKTPLDLAWQEWTPNFKVINLLLRYGATFGIRKSAAKCLKIGGADILKHALVNGSEFKVDRYERQEIIDEFIKSITQDDLDFLNKEIESIKNKYSQYAAVFNSIETRQAEIKQCPIAVGFYRLVNQMKMKLVLKEDVLNPQAVRVEDSKEAKQEVKESKEIKSLGIFAKPQINKEELALYASFYDLLVRIEKKYTKFSLYLPENWKEFLRHLPDQGSLTAFKISLA